MIKQQVTQYTILVQVCSQPDMLINRIFLLSEATPPVSTYAEYNVQAPTVAVSESEGVAPPPLGPHTQPMPAVQYSPVVHHWFYCKIVSDKPIWHPFSHKDSMYLEEAFLNGKSFDNTDLLL